MINFHRPELWQRDFTLRAPAARPPCGDLCFVWDGSAESLRRLLDQAGSRSKRVRWSARAAARRHGSSVYVRDPDGNLLEFMIYLEEGHDVS